MKAISRRAERRNLLIENAINTQLLTGCGACIGVCPTSTRYFREYRHLFKVWKELIIYV